MTIGPVILAWLSLAVLPSVDRSLSFDRGPDRLRIEIGGRPFATYVWEHPTVRRPFFMDVRSPSGVPVTRSFPPVEGKEPTDHAAMHPGLWLAFGDLSGADLWRNRGVVRHAGFIEEPAADQDGGRFAVRNRYEANGKTLCEEECRIRVRVTPRGTRIDWQSTFRGVEGLAFGDQEEMGLGLRVASGLTVARGGRIASSEGRLNEAGVWGRQADWCDYSGQGAGVLLMPGPSNFRRSWFHARDYGLLVANPFGRRAFTKGEPSRVVVVPGEALVLRFGVLVHDGDVDRHAAYRDYREAAD